MKKITLSDVDVELFDIEISPSDYLFFSRHKDAFKTMWKQQGKPFWTRFEITFRSFTVKHGIIKKMNIDSPKFQNMIDEAFIFIHDQFVDVKENVAKNFIEDIAKLAQNRDKFAGLDSKSFAKDPFFARETRELFRNFFGSPQQKSSYLKVYVYSPIYLRFGGSVCRCLVRWVDAPTMEDTTNDSYWIKPQPYIIEKKAEIGTKMCKDCGHDCIVKHFHEKFLGDRNHPITFECWTFGDPRFNDPDNPLYAPDSDPSSDWRELLNTDLFRDFYNYVKEKYGDTKDSCKKCHKIKKKDEKVSPKFQTHAQKQIQKDEEQQLIRDLCEVHDCIGKLDEQDRQCCETMIHDIIKDHPSILDVIEEAERKVKLEKMHHSEVNATEEKGKMNEEIKEMHLAIDINNSLSENLKLFLLNLMQDENQDGNRAAANSFKVIKIEDQAKGHFEVNVSAYTREGSAEEHFIKLEKKKEKLYSKEMNEFILATEFLRSKIRGLPKKFEWHEGRGFAAAVMNYEIEEQEHTSKWTNFTIIIHGYEEIGIKQTLIKLMCSIVKQKRHQCDGWSMQVEDVVACILPEMPADIEDLVITLQLGFRFENRLTDSEKDSLAKHQDNITSADILCEQMKCLAENFVVSPKDSEMCAKDLGLKTLGIHSNLQVICTNVGDICLCKKAPAVSQDNIKLDCLKVRVTREDYVENLKLVYTGLSLQGLKQLLSTVQKHEKRFICLKNSKCKEPNIIMTELAAKFAGVGIESEKTLISIPINEEPLLGKIPIQMANEMLKMITIQGMQSSLHFTFQNGKYEQTIIVSFGAYMPEDKLQELDAQDFVKFLVELEENGNNRVFEKKVEVKKKKLKMSKSTQADWKIHKNVETKIADTTPDMAFACLEELSKNEQNSKKFNEVIQKENMNQIMSNKKNQVLVPNNHWEKHPNGNIKSENSGKEVEYESYQNRCFVKQDKSDQSRCDIYQGELLSDKETEIDCYKYPTIDVFRSSGEVGAAESNLKNDTIKCINQVIDDLNDMIKEPSRKCSTETETDISNENVIAGEICNGSLSSNRGKSFGDVGNIDNDVSLKNVNICQHQLSENGKPCELGDTGIVLTENDTKKKMGLRLCANCKKVEPTRKAFKKCQKCKEECVIEVRYYCSRACQVDDWWKRHKVEHADGQLCKKNID